MEACWIPTGSAEPSRNTQCYTGHILPVSEQAELFTPIGFRISEGRQALWRMSSRRCQRLQCREQRIMGKKRAERGCRQHLVFRFKRGQCLGSLQHARMEAVSRDRQPSWSTQSPALPAGMHNTGKEWAFKITCRVFVFCEERNPHRSDPLPSPPLRFPAGTITASCGC